MSRFLSLSSCHRAATLAVACLFATAAPTDAQSPAPTPSWWTNQGLLRSAAPADSAFATVGQLKNTVWCLARELDQRWTAEGGCGDELRAIVRSWDRNFPASSAAATNLPAPDVVKDGSMLAVINQGQLKNMAITAYRRLKELGLPIDLQDRDPTNGALVPFAVDPDDPAKLPWRTGENAAPAMVGQLKFCFSFELPGSLGRSGQVLAWDQSGTLQPVPAGLERVVAVSAGPNHNLALKDDGTVVAWSGNYGLIDVPTGLRNVVAISAGDYHSLALKMDGTVVAWGANEAGRRSVPTGLDHVVAISAGSLHSLALKDDGTVVAWGGQNYGGTEYYNSVRGYYGQANVPTGLKNVVAISAGRYHSLALKADGTVVAWGASADPSSSQYSYYSVYTEPPSWVNRFPDNYDRGQVTVPPGLQAVGIVAEGLRSAALLRDGTVRVWGEGATQLAGAANGVQLAAGGYGALLLQPGGIAQAWSGGTLNTNLPSTVKDVIQVSSGGVALAIVDPTSTTRPDLPAFSGPAHSFGPEDGTLNGVYFRSSVISPSAVNYTAMGLPPGLSIDAVTGVVSGTPTNAQRYESTIVATNAVGATQQRVVFNLNILLPVIITPSLGNALVQVPYTQTVQVLSDYTEITSSAVTGLPPGLSYDPASRTISGVPTALGIYEVVIRVISLLGTVSRTLSVEVAQIAAWGSNSSGRTAGLKDVVAIAAGGSHSLALKSDGTVVAWGANDYGQSKLPTGLSDVTAIAAGYSHSLALRSDGTVVAWGFNSYDQTTVPVGLSSVVAIAAGGSHNLALKSDGTVVAWGYNSYGQTNVPAGLSGVVAISAGGYHSMALKSDGTVVGWGYNSSGQTQVPAGLSDVTAIAAGFFHSLALKSDGSVVAWGSNSFGESTMPAGLSGVVAIAAGHSRSLVLNSQGTVAEWGYHSSGSSTVPVGLVGVVAIAAGIDHSLALISDERIPLSSTQTFGSHGNQLSGVYYRARVAGVAPFSYGATGLPAGLSLDAATGVVSGQPIAQGTTTAAFTATDAAGRATTWQVSFSLSNLHPSIDSTLTTTLTLSSAYSRVIETRHADTVSVSGLPPGLVWNAATQTITGAPSELGDYTVTVTASNPFGTVSKTNTLRVAPWAAWGDNSYGQINVPTGVSDVVAVAAGISHSLALMGDGTVVAWGEDNFFHHQTRVPAGLSGVVAIAAAGASSLALKGDGTVVAWGRNTYGQSTVPANLIDVVAIAAGPHHNLALKSDGTVVAWGYNGTGATDIPVGLSGVIAVAATYGYSLALKSDGTVVEWGGNGTGATNVPAGLTGVVAVAPGLALKNDGTVVEWGGNGTGATNVPAGLTGVVSIARGYSHSLALKSDGTVVAWGQNGSGEINVPTGLSGVTAIVAGDHHSLAVAGTRAPKLLSGHHTFGPEANLINGVYYRARLVGVGPFSYSATGLPAGLSLDAATGVVSGRPIAQGTTTAAFTATDAAGRATTWQVSFSLTNLQPSINTTLTGILTISSPYSRVMDIHYGDTVVVTGLPPGLVWDESSRTLTGAPSEVGDYAVTVTATNPFGSVSKTDMLSVVSVVGWGWNFYGQTQVPAALSGVIGIAAQDYASVALSSDGSVVEWGSLGQQAVPAGLTDLVAISVGSFHSLALKGDGSIVAWGANENGQTTVPAGLTDIVSIAAGGSHSLALKNDGTVVTWGANEHGQSTVPAGLNGVVAIAGGWWHSVALKSDGTVVVWGDDSIGQSTVPAGLSDVTAVAARGHHNLALKSDGTVVAWGYNSSGQTTVPSGLSGVVAIAAGSFHSLALKSDGTVVAWGANPYGESTTPAGLSGAVAISAGRYHSLALLRESGTVPRFLSPVAAIAFVGQNRTHYLALESSGTATFSATDLPPGLVIDSPTGAITGTPTTTGTYTVTLTATNAHGTTTKEVKFYVNP